ncbi:MAG: DUF2871 domain-containing protein [Tissierellia bacterium]|nr:DUF2871 domain-containing protein [Tissierellia bacterium]
MKKYLNISFAYALAAMIGGVFYREFTKYNGFHGITMLGKLHTHLFVLGMIIFMVVALFEVNLRITEIKLFRKFMIVYNLGLITTVVMMLVRGTIQVLQIPLEKSADSAISGIAGIGHILLGAGIIMLITVLRKSAQNKVHS